MKILATKLWVSREVITGWDQDVEKIEWWIMGQLNLAIENFINLSPKRIYKLSKELNLGDPNDSIEKFKKLNSLKIELDGEILFPYQVNNLNNGLEIIIHAEVMDHFDPFLIVSGKFFR